MEDKKKNPDTASSTEKSEYSAPQLVEYGSVADMINAGPIPVPVDSDSGFTPGPT